MGVLGFSLGELPHQTDIHNHWADGTGHASYDLVGLISWCARDPIPADLFAKINVPTMLLQGGADSMTSPAEAAEEWHPSLVSGKQDFPSTRRRSLVPKQSLRQFPEASSCARWPELLVIIQPPYSDRFEKLTPELPSTASSVDVHRFQRRQVSHVGKPKEEKGRELTTRKSQPIPHWFYKKAHGDMIAV